MLRNLPIQKHEETWRAMANDVIKYVDQDGAVRLDNEVIISVARR
jgi:hypothetical protein